MPAAKFAEEFFRAGSFENDRVCSSSRRDEGSLPSERSNLQKARIRARIRDRAETGDTEWKSSGVAPEPMRSGAGELANDTIAACVGVSIETTRSEEGE